MTVPIEKINEIIRKFEEEIKEYEDMMFGLMLYQETSPKFIKSTQKISYKNIKRRGEAALNEAKSILSDAKQGKPIKYTIPFFEFPVITEEMWLRIEVTLQSYKELYPDRPCNKSLTEEEIIALRNEVMNRI